MPEQNGVADGVFLGEETPTVLTVRRRNRRYAQYKKVQDLRTQGLSYRAIAAQLHLSRQTVRRYSVADAFPERATRRPVRSKLDPFKPLLEQWLAAGEDNALQLWRDLRDQHGYTGSRAVVSRWVAQHRHLVLGQDRAEPAKRRRGRPAQPAKAAPPAPQRRLSARKVVEHQPPGGWYVRPEPGMSPTFWFLPSFEHRFLFYGGYAELDNQCSVSNRLRMVFPRGVLT